MADQSYVPSDQIAPTFDISAFHGFVAGASPSYNGGASIQSSVSIAIAAIVATFAPIRLV